MHKTGDKALFQEKSACARKKNLFWSPHKPANVTNEAEFVLKGKKSKQTIGGGKLRYCVPDDEKKNSYIRTTQFLSAHSISSFAKS